jgi:hypothetical protein
LGGPPWLDEGIATFLHLWHVGEIALRCGVGHVKWGVQIPDELWMLAAKLSDEHGLSRTASVLKLDYYSLKKRVAAKSSDSISGPRFSTAVNKPDSFIEASTKHSQHSILTSELRKRDLVARDLEGISSECPACVVASSPSASVHLCCFTSKGIDHV